MFIDGTKIYTVQITQEDAVYLQTDLFAGYKLTGITLTAGWDFHFLKVLFAGSEEWVFFPQER